MENSSMNTISRAGLLVIAFAVVLQIYLFYLILFPFKVFEINEVPIPVTKKEFHKGEVVPLIIDYCKTVNTPDRIIAQLSTYDGSLGDKTLPVSLSLGQQERALPEGCHKYISFSWAIPSDADAGKYRLDFIVEHQINVFRSIDQYFQSEPFFVVK